MTKRKFGTSPTAESTLSKSDIFLDIKTSRPIFPASKMARSESKVMAFNLIWDAYQTVENRDYNKNDHLYNLLVFLKLNQQEIDWNSLGEYQESLAWSLCFLLLHVHMSCLVKEESVNFAFNLFKIFSKLAKDQQQTLNWKATSLRKGVNFATAPLAWLVAFLEYFDSSLPSTLLNQLTKGAISMELIYRPDEVKPIRKYNFNSDRWPCLADFACYFLQTRNQNGVFKQLLDSPPEVLAKIDLNSIYVFSGSSITLITQIFELLHDRMQSFETMDQSFLAGFIHEQMISSYQWTPELMIEFTLLFFKNFKVSEIINNASREFLSNFKDLMDVLSFSPLNYKTLSSHLKFLLYIKSFENEVKFEVTDYYEQNPALAENAYACVGLKLEAGEKKADYLAKVRSGPYYAKVQYALANMSLESLQASDPGPFGRSEYLKFKSMQLLQYTFRWAYFTHKTISQKNQFVLKVMNQFFSPTVFYTSLNELPDPQFRLNVKTLVNNKHLPDHKLYELAEENIFRALDNCSLKQNLKIAQEEMRRTRDDLFYLADRMSETLPKKTPQPQEKNQRPITDFFSKQQEEKQKRLVPQDSQKQPMAILRN
jgi:hypothetical protein